MKYLTTQVDFIQRGFAALGERRFLHYQVMITVNGKKITWREGMTVADLLNDLNDSYTYIVVRINDKQVSRPDFDKALIPDNSKIFLVPMVAGG